MTFDLLLTRSRGVFVMALALVAWGLTPAAANAGLIEWSAEVNTGSPVTFTATNIFTPSLLDIGALSGDITYEFIVNGGDRAAAGSLIGSYTGGQSQAIRFEQWHNTNEYGATQYGIDDYVFNVPTTFDTDIHLAFVVNSAAGSTSLFVNGVDTGSTVPLAVTLHGTVGFGATDMGSHFLPDDAFAGKIIGFASYDSALSAAELKAHSDAYFETATVPEPTSLALLGIGMIGLAGHRWQRRKH